MCSLFCGLLYGQTATVSSIISSYAITTPTGFTGQVFSTLELGVYYPAGLSPSSYITNTQLNSDFQGFISGYPNPSDAPEAYLSVALQGILNKYPQILGGTLTAAISGPPQVVNGMPIPGTGTPIGSISVAIGTFNTAGIATIATGTPGQTVTVSAIASSWTVSLPSGFTGQAFSALRLGVTYPTGLPSSSYITSKQLNSDFQGFITAYPNPADPPEAYLSVSLKGILNKYSQIPGGTLSATISGPPQVIGGITIPGSGTQVGTINVGIGTFNGLTSSLYGFTYFGQSGTVSGITSSWAVTLPMGFSGPVFSVLNLGVTYPIGLTPASYITNQQLNADFQGFISAYPNPSDAPEAYLSIALQQILNKYAQIPAGTLIGEINAPGMTYPGTTLMIPGALIGTVEVILGTYNSNSVAIPFTRSNAPGSVALPKPIPFR